LPPELWLVLPLVWEVVLADVCIFALPLVVLPDFRLLPDSFVLI